MAFWRRSKGRHALGAAVTSIPAVAGAPEPQRATFPPQVTPHQAAPPAGSQGADLSTPPVLAAPSYPPAPPSSLDWSFPELHPPAPSGPRVELTFRDGTSASLDGVQARALDEIAQALTRRDEVKH